MALIAGVLKLGTTERVRAHDGGGRVPAPVSTTEHVVDHDLLDGVAALLRIRHQVDTGALVRGLAAKPELISELLGEMTLGPAISLVGTRLRAAYHSLSSDDNEVSEGNLVAVFSVDLLDPCQLRACGETRVVRLVQFNASV